MKNTVRTILRIACGAAAAFFILGTVASIAQKTSSGTVGFGVIGSALFLFLFKKLSVKTPERAEPPQTEGERLPKENTEFARHFFRSHIRDYTAFDLESTGLDTKNDRIIEIAAVRVRDGKETDSFHTLVNPGRKIPKGPHGIDGGMVADAPDAAQALSDFLAFCGSDVLVAHNAERFDGPLLLHELERAGLPFFSRIADSIWMARLYFPGLGSYRLQAICEKIGFQPETAHRALPDARAVVAVTEAAREAFRQNPDL